MASKTIIEAAVAELKYTQQRNAQACRCHTQATRKKLAALGVRITGLPRCGWGPN